MSTGVAGLRRFVAPAPAPAPPVERCDLCATEVPGEHRHLVPVERTIRCACRACALLFTDRSDGGYRTIPERWLTDPAFTLDDAQWDALQIPVGLAFFLRSATGAVTTCYPGPAGATESELDVEAGHLDGLGRLGALMEPDVEALLVRRDTDESLLVPVDACYRLVGLVRTHWRGFDGGTAAWERIEEFFADARARAREVRG